MTELDSSDVVRARLDFSYDGGAYLGWAEQPGLPTIQGALNDAAARVVRTKTDFVVRFAVAGRTDAGVHARGQVAHCDIPRDAWERIPGRSGKTPPVSLLERLNGVLPPDIVINACVEAPEGFDARFSAEERQYTYRLSDSPTTRDPLRRGHVLWHRRAVDVDILNAASATLTGLRDFGPFCRARDGATTVRELREFSWERPTTGTDEGLVVATVRADAFCHSMVRSLVGAVIMVGEGRRDMDWLARQTSVDGRSQAVKVALPHGLTLEHVVYPPDADMALRAEVTRNRRTLD
ncbi:MAG: tRNA pseudouridine(38-40) synthase TruA [Actinobacteria bacterium HGW-Actinobacteria-4]|nr:MAG: tRNA pseudouridine(38-40) synthase TruA [Actinobacteria bacterium HGW-Actinobacteria-4]